MVVVAHQEDAIGAGAIAASAIEAPVRPAVVATETSAFGCAPERLAQPPDEGAVGRDELGSSCSTSTLMPSTPICLDERHEDRDRCVLDLRRGEQALVARVPKLV